MNPVEQKLASRFWNLFDGRRDAWGAVHGECKKQPVTLPLIWGHLFHDGSVGIYPLVDGERLDAEETMHPDEDRPPEGMYVRWGCTDIDLHGTRGVTPELALILAKNLQKALKLLGITAWVELTKGGGYHVWVFAAEWVPAEDMRRALLVAHEVAGVPVTEVNPKQTSLDHMVVGNYVNLPYAKTWADKGTRVVLGARPMGGMNGHTDLWPIRLWDFVTVAEECRTPVTAVAAAAALYTPPPARQEVGADLLPVTRADGSFKAITDRLPGLAWTIFDKGPLPGADRSTLMLDFAHQCRDAGLTPDECYTLLADIDGRWGKGYLTRNPPAEKYLREKVTHAYG